MGDLARALPQLVAAACQVGDLGGVARQLDGHIEARQVRSKAMSGPTGARAPLSEVRVAVVK
jgi:hypothetical protein